MSPEQLQGIQKVNQFYIDRQKLSPEDQDFVKKFIESSAGDMKLNEAITPSHRGEHPPPFRVHTATLNTMRTFSFQTMQASCLEGAFKKVRVLQQKL